MPYSQKAFVLLITLAAITAVGFPLFAPSIFPPTGWVAYAGAAFTLLGWLTREFFAIRASRKQHTISVLLQSRMSTAFNDRYKAMVLVYPVTPAITPIKLNDWHDPQKIDAIEAMKYFLNYYEFIAIGVRTGDLDEAYLRMSLRHIVINLCSMGDAYIQCCRTEDQNVYKNLLWLRNKWAAELAQESRSPRRAIKLN